MFPPRFVHVLLGAWRFGGTPLCAPGGGVTKAIRWGVGFCCFVDLAFVWGKAHCFLTKRPQVVGFFWLPFPWPPVFFVHFFLDIACIFFFSRRVAPGANMVLLYLSNVSF